MSDKEKEIIEKIAKAVPKLSDMDKGYLLGRAEELAEQAEKKNEEECWKIFCTQFLNWRNC